MLESSSFPPLATGPQVVLQSLNYYPEGSNGKCKLFVKAPDSRSAIFQATISDAPDNIHKIFLAVSYSFPHGPVTSAEM